MAPLPPRDLDREGGEPPGSGFPPSESLKTPPGGSSRQSGLSLVRLPKLCYPSISELGRKMWFKKTNKHHYKEYFNPLVGICL